ncbi:MAG: PHP domain-containing protein [Candidatus Omnitrophica bacterium]|nr:PHP domain-containing protein [Candidatus Omnitrophota bacterium]
MKERYADLHVHTHYSDSTLSPEEVVKAARLNNVDAFAVTDHDCVDGIGPCIQFGEKSGVEVIPGIELTVDLAMRPAEPNGRPVGYEVHILGLFIDWKDRHLIAKVAEIQKSRVERIYTMTGLLKDEGISVDPGDVLKLAGRGTVGRLHLAFAMIKNRQVKSVREAFRKYIGNQAKCYAPHLKCTPAEAIGMITKAGGVPVLAHPALIGNDDFIPDFIRQGLRGIEVYHSDHDQRMEKKYRGIAEENGLLITGGSDCHGMGKGRIMIGNVMVKYELVEKLRHESERIRKAR